MGKVNPSQRPYYQEGWEGNRKARLKPLLPEATEKVFFSCEMKSKHI